MRSTLFSKLLALVLAAILALGVFTSCDLLKAKDPKINITNGEEVLADKVKTVTDKCKEVIEKNYKPLW